MPGLYEKIRRLLSPERAERGAEDDIIENSPEAVRPRMRQIQQRRKISELQSQMDAAPEGPEKDRLRAKLEAGNA